MSSKLLRVRLVMTYSYPERKELKDGRSPLRKRDSSIERQQDHCRVST